MAPNFSQEGNLNQQKNPLHSCSYCLSFCVTPCAFRDDSSVDGFQESHRRPHAEKSPFIRKKITEYHRAGLGMCEVRATKASSYMWRALWTLPHSSKRVCVWHVHTCGVRAGQPNTHTATGDGKRARRHQTSWMEAFQRCTLFPPGGRRRRLITSAISHSPSPISHFLITGGRYRIGERRKPMSPLSAVSRRCLQLHLPATAQIAEAHPH